MLVRLLYLLLITFLVKLLFRGLAERMGLALGSRSEGGRGERMPTVYKGLMVRDPVCGLYVPESRALTERRGSERFHFCSARCQKAFRESAR